MHTGDSLAHVERLVERAGSHYMNVPMTERDPTVRLASQVVLKYLCTRDRSRIAAGQWACARCVTNIMSVLKLCAYKAISGPMEAE